MTEIINSSKVSRFPVIIVLIALALFPVAGVALADSDDRDDQPKVTLKRFGKPCFWSVDFHLFSESVQDIPGLPNGKNGILTEPEHRFHPALFIGPALPMSHPTTMSTEMVRGASASTTNGSLRRKISACRTRFFSPSW